MLLMDQSRLIIVQNTLLGGINMVDYDPWNGNYTNTIVRDNTILGGFSTDTPQPGEKTGVFEGEVVGIKGVVKAISQDIVAVRPRDLEVGHEQ